MTSILTKHGKSLSDRRNLIENQCAIDGMIRPIKGRSKANQMRDHLHDDLPVSNNRARPPGKNAVHDLVPVFSKP
ncbi:MAG TPA: hypothetical protein DHU81_13230, partial [Hyphomonas sp.]|nr:hypothetical protein [Hyphomonas sp.]